MNLDDTERVRDECRSLELTAYGYYEIEDYFAAMKCYAEMAEKYRDINAFELAGSCYQKAGDCYLRTLDELNRHGNKVSKGESTGDFSALLAAGCFAEARKLYRENHTYHEAREMRVLEMDAVRTFEGKNFRTTRPCPTTRRLSAFSWLKLSIMKYLFGYGERPLRFGLWILLIVFVFAIVYCPSQWGVFDIELHGVDWDGTLLSNFSTALYFSIVTFATLGYGDIHPHNGWAKFLVCFEVAFGFVMLGALIVLIGRQITYD